MNNHPQNRFDIYAVAEDFLLETGPSPPTKYFTVASTIEAFTMIYGETMSTHGSQMEYPVVPKHFGYNHPELIELWFQASKLRLQHKLELGMMPPRENSIEKLSNSTTNKDITIASGYNNKSNKESEESEQNIEAEVGIKSNHQIIEEKEIEGNGITAQLARKTQGRRAGKAKKG